ncbi:MAG: response regulator [Butyrivibrio sp.]|nr:response regulator [Butyrivibrio sp.]
MANILIVDDSRTSRRMLRDILERSGHVIIGEAVDGQEGYNEYVKLKPDIVTMDITMPVMDGIDSLKLIRKEDPNAKVVMITAAGQKEKMMEALKLGASEFITKPFNDDVVISTVNNLAK